MTGPLAQQFAQVRKNLDLITDEGHCTCGRVYACDWCLEQEALDALSAIERHVQDMETALATARKTLEVIEEPMHFDDLEAIADDRVKMQAAARSWLEKDRAALPASETPQAAAREKGEETNG